MNKTRIAKNFCTYIMQELPQDFWEDWKTNRDSMKAMGIVPFKRDDTFYIAIYDGNTLTEKEYLEQEVEYFKEVRQELVKYFNSHKSIYSVEEFDAIRNIICTEKTLDGLNKIEKYSDNYRYILKEIEDRLFKSMLSD